MQRTTTFTARPSVIPMSTPHTANDGITKPLVGAHGSRLFTESATVRYSTPISATWQMEVSNVATALVPATGDKPGGTRYTMKPIHIARRWGNVSRLGQSREEVRCGDGEDVR